VTLKLPSRPEFFILITLVIAMAVCLPAGISTAKEWDTSAPPLPSYFQLSAGAAFVPNQTLKDGSTSQSRIESETGFVVGGAIGTRLFEGFRGEIAVDYREADTREAANERPPPPDPDDPRPKPDGDLNLLSLMFNAYYDLDLGLPVSPYAGAGIGWGRLNVDMRRKTAGELDIDDTDDVFVYNAMVGLIAPVSQAASFALGYRYVGVAGADSIGATIGDVDQDIEAEFDAHELTLGLRFNF